MLRLLRTLIGLLGLALLTTQGASAAASASAENRASGSAAVAEQRVGNDTRLSEEAVRKNLGLRYDFASDSPVAAEGAAVADTSGTVTLNVFGATHMNATVTFGSEALTTGVANINGVAMVGEEGVVGATQSLSFSVPNAQGALNFAQGSIGPIGPYSVFSNSCVTYCGSVLNAAGVEGVPTGTGAILTFLGLR
jgi:hypothetical protein